MANDTFSLEGKVSLVTGAGAGIGRACALALARAGARVMATDIDEAAAAETAALAAEEGLTVSASRQDVCDEARWRQVIAATIDAFGGFDVLVNNAGIHQGCLLEADTLDNVRRLHRSTWTRCFSA